MELTSYLGCGLVLRFLRRLDALLGFFINQVSPPIGIRLESAPQLRETLDITNAVRDDFVRDWALKKNKEKKAAKANAAAAGFAEGQPSINAEAQLTDTGIARGDEIQPSSPAPGHAAAVNEKKKTSPVKAKENKKHEPTPEETAGKKRRRSYRMKILFGLVLPSTLQGLDMTIVASALPFIAKSFNETKELNWIISAFNLTSAAFPSFLAQIVDIFGRHAAIQATILITLVGSAICTGAPTSVFGVLLLGRSLQGVGVSGIGISVRTVLADRVSLKEYALSWTLLALLNTITFSIGPIVGGFLTQISWRWCFAINIPVGVLAIVVVWLLLRKELLGLQPLPELEGVDTTTRHGRFWVQLSTIDYGGQLLFLWGLGLLILAFTWAGGSYAWDTVNVLALLVLGAVLTVAWFAYEYSMSPQHLMSRVFKIQRAMMPWEVLSQRDIGLLFYITFSLAWPCLRSSLS